MSAAQILVLTPEELDDLLTRAAKRALDLRDKGDELNLRASAKLIRRRVNDVSHAISEGHLPARREGKALMINRKDLLAWNRATPRGSQA